jgi:hypothetical protein
LTVGGIAALVRGSDHGLNFPGRAVRVKPLPGLRITVGADFDVRATGLMEKEVPVFPVRPPVRRVLGRAILFFVHWVPLPGGFLLGQALPRFVP